MCLGRAYIWKQCNHLSFDIFFFLSRTGNITGKEKQSHSLKHDFIFMKNNLFQEMQIIKHNSHLSNGVKGDIIVGQTLNMLIKSRVFKF